MSLSSCVGGGDGASGLLNFIPTRTMANRMADQLEDKMHTHMEETVNAAIANVETNVSKKTQAIQNQVWPWIVLLLGLYGMERLGSWGTKYVGWRQQRRIEQVINGNKPEHKSRSPP